MFKLLHGEVSENLWLVREWEGGRADQPGTPPSCADGLWEKREQVQQKAGENNSARPPDPTHSLGSVIRINFTSLSECWKLDINIT